MEVHNLKRATALLILAASFVSLSSFALAAVADGYVVKVQGGAVYLDWGTSSGIAVGDSFEVYRSGEELKHPVTGESLGHTQTVLVDGVVESVDEKFAVGKVFDSKGVVKTGDRTRLKAAAPPPPTAAKTSLVLSPQTALPAPKEIWRSETIKREGMGLALGDVDGDKKLDVVVAYRKKIEVFHWTGAKLESVGLYESRDNRNFLAVDVANIDGSGSDKIYASFYMEGSRRAKTIILEFASGSFKEVARLDGFVRAFDRMNAKREVIGQDISMARELRMRPPVHIEKSGDKYQAGPSVQLPGSLHARQLFGYAWGDWDQDGVEDFGVLHSGERLTLFMKGAKWTSREAYGGSRADFVWEQEQIGTVFARMVSYGGGNDKPMLLVPHNISSTGIRFARLRVYKESELISLRWNGAEMVPLWILPIAGALADFAVGDVANNGTPQLWVAALGSNDKTVILSYQLP